jgi:hypothetical protein
MRAMRAVPAMPTMLVPTNKFVKTIFLVGNHNRRPLPPRADA